MRRREFIAGLGSAAAWPVVARAQQDDRMRALLLQILRLQAEGAAEKISLFIKEIVNQVGWTTQLPWSSTCSSSPSSSTSSTSSLGAGWTHWTYTCFDQRRFDSLRQLRQAPAILEVAQARSHRQGAATVVAARHAGLGEPYRLFKRPQIHRGGSQEGLLRPGLFPKGV